jgi:hypothetical protein
MSTVTTPAKLAVSRREVAEEETATIALFKAAECVNNIETTF